MPHHCIRVQCMLYGHRTLDTCTRLSAYTDHDKYKNIDRELHSESVEVVVSNEGHAFRPLNGFFQPPITMQFDLLSCVLHSNLESLTLAKVLGSRLANGMSIISSKLPRNAFKSPTVSNTQQVIDLSPDANCLGFDSSCVVWNAIFAI